MAKSIGCHCGESIKPIENRAWVALTRRVHDSPPDSATVKCLGCGKLGRTNAKYVDQLPYAPTWQELAKLQAAHLDKKEPTHD